MPVITALKQTMLLNSPRLGRLEVEVDIISNLDWDKGFKLFDDYF